MAFGMTTLEEWLETANRAAEHGLLSALKVHHVIYNDDSGGLSKGDEVFGGVFQPNKPWSAKDLAALITGKCQVYAQGLRGVQTFKVFAYYGKEEPSAFHHITLSGKLSAGLGETEQANPKGQIAQGMRMADLVVARSFEMMNRLWTVNEHMLAQLAQDRDSLQTSYRQAEEIVHTLLREKIEASHTQRMRELEFERSTGERQKLITFLPALLHHMGIGIVPDSMADTAILESAALAIRKMPEEERLDTMTKLAGVSPELAMVLGKRLQEIAVRQERDEEASRMLAKVKSEEEVEHDKALAREALGMVPKLGGEG